MESGVEERLQHWVAAGLVDHALAERIRAWEATHAPARTSRLGRLAFGLGGLLLGAGILLFVASHWAELSPWGRLGLLAATVFGLHAAGGWFASRSAALATTLHAIGTAALGAGIFLSGQAFNLAEHWPEGFLLWSLGAAFALWWLRDWPHVVWVAVLVPAWLVSGWYAHFATSMFESDVTGLHVAIPPAVGLFLTAVAYLTVVGPSPLPGWRRALARLGGLALLPAGIALAVTGVALRAYTGTEVTFPGEFVLGLGVAVVAPLVLGVSLRGREAWPLLVGAAFALTVAFLDTGGSTGQVVLHLLYLAACCGLAWWGLHDGHKLRVNVAVAGFALTVLSFYFSSLFDKFGRALGLIVLGVLFLGGGWLLERMRRQLIGRIDTGVAS